MPLRPDRIADAPGFESGFGLRQALFTVLTLVAATLAPTPASSLVVPLTVDVPAVSAQGDLLLNGLPTSPGAGDLAAVGLVSLEGGEFTVGLTNAQAWGPIWVIPGSYRPTYQFFFASDDLPINPAEVLGGPLVVDGFGDEDIDIPSVEISFEFRQNGIAFPAAVGEVANFLLRNAASGEEFIVASASAGTTVVSIVPGPYDVIYAYVSGTQIAQNTHAVVLQGADLSFPQTVIVDVPVFSHTVFATLNALPFPASPLERGEIHLRNFDSGDAVSFGLTNAGSGPRRIIPGTYDATYSRVAGGTVAPLNANAVVAEGLVISPPPTPGQLSLTQIDVHSFAVTLDATLDGNPFVASPLETGNIVLTTDRGDEANLGPTHVSPSATYQVVGGRYDVYYRNQAGATAVPANPNAKITERVRISVDQTLSIDITSIVLDFEFRLNGLPFPMSILERGDFTLVGSSVGDVISIGSTHVAPPARRVVAGRYDLIYEWKAGSVSAPRNVGHHVLHAANLVTDQTVLADLPTSSIVPTFELNSVAFPIDPGQRGRIVLRDFDGGIVDLGRTDVAVPATVVAVDGYYAIDYQWEAGVDVPRNAREPVGTVVVPEPGGGTGLILGLLWLMVVDRLSPRASAPARRRLVGSRCAPVE
jgi:hypothetical protein